MDVNNMQPNHYEPLWPLRDPTTPRLPGSKGGGGGGGGEGKSGGLPAPSLPKDVDLVLDQESRKKTAASAPTRAKETEIFMPDAANKPDPPKVCHTIKNRVKFYCGGEITVCTDKHVSSWSGSI